ncbi:PAS domain-containing protein [Aquincola sp. S2]|uniref:histidine kinase n=1 Tax=Pseudaquabacterium terrae TaxID=2732868 RepID=A0ABX2ELI8_9BURK|nr:PAS domain-containing protein [Aquabacterium terrae]NRF69540.1 PAS domain-containing protein [Aquabacterium terrae]
MPSGLHALTQAALLEHLDRDDAAFALRRLVADASKHLGLACGLLAVAPDGQPRWTTGAVPDAAVRPGTPLARRHEPFFADGFCWLPLWRMGQSVGAWLLAAEPADDLNHSARVLQPLLQTAASLLLRDQAAAVGRPGGSQAELIRAALRGTSTFVWEWDIRTDRFAETDEGFAQLGYPPPEAGATQRDWDALIHPDDLDENHEAYLRHARGEVSVYESVYRARAAGGRWHWLQERGRIIEWDAEGQPLRMVGIQADITEHRAAEEAAAQAAARLTKIASHVPGMLFQFVRRPDGSSRFPYVSERCESLFGVPAEAMLEDAAAMLRRIDFTDRGLMLDSIEASMRDQTPWQLSFRIHRRDGMLRWIRGSATPQAEADGSCLWHGYFEDVTEALTVEQAHQQRAAAEAANRAKTEFLSRMSHELRTPLNAVLGFAQLLEVDSATTLPPEQLRRVTLIREAGEHLLEMINDLLDLTIIEAGRLALQTEAVALDGLVDDCLSMVLAAAQQAGVTLLHEPLPALTVQGDRKRLRQVLLNLLSNAIKYNRRGGQVLVHCLRLDDGAVALRVIDSGSGLTEAEIGQLFQPFNRLSHAHGPIEGTGIGLAVTQALVALMGARIEVASQPGQGSTFSVIWPAALVGGLAL